MSPAAPPCIGSPNSTAAPALVMIGNFDGVHLGHQDVLRHAQELAQRHHLVLKVLTFEPHPRTVVQGVHVGSLTTVQRKQRLMEAIVEDVQVVVHPFTMQTAQLSPEEFCRQILRDELSAALVLVGANFRFGRERAGDLSLLQELGGRFSFEARAIELSGDEEGSYSSTRIRKLLSEGQVRDAAKLLGRPHLVSGLVVHGDGRGRSIGFPTANLEEIGELLPKDGVYAVRVYDLGDGARLLAAGALSVGPRPTVDRPHAVEVHLLDFNQSLYGHRLGLDLLERVRGIERFDTVDALRTQIQTDIGHVRDEVANLADSARAWGFEDSACAERGEGRD